jgi:hypothetical protein
MQGISTPEFQAKLLKNREGLEAKLARREGYWNG